jgi:hypothetical protein
LIELRSWRSAAQQQRAPDSPPRDSPVARSRSACCKTGQRVLRYATTRGDSRTISLLPCSIPLLPSRAKARGWGQSHLLSATPRTLAVSWATKGAVTGRTKAARVRDQVRRAFRTKTRWADTTSSGEDLPSPTMRSYDQSNRFPLPRFCGCPLASAVAWEYGRANRMADAGADRLGERHALGCRKRRST